MKNVLLVTSSPRGEASHSTKIATELAQGIGGNLVVRDLWRNPLPVIGPDFVHAMFTAEAERTPAQREALRFSDETIAELEDADVVVVAAGMINFGMPAGLKTWIDHITRAGVTFKYGEAGPVGLITGKRAILVLASGAVFSTGPYSAMDHLEPALRGNLGFIGFTDIETIRMEGVAFGEEAVLQALSQATERSRELVATVR